MWAWGKYVGSVGLAVWESYFQNASVFLVIDQPESDSVTSGGTRGLRGEEKVRLDHGGALERDELILVREYIGTHWRLKLINIKCDWSL